MPGEEVQVPEGLISPGGAKLYHTDMFRPTYRPMSGARWKMEIVPLNLCPGYWSGVQVVTNMAVLARQVEGCAGYVT